MVVLFCFVLHRAVKLGKFLLSLWRIILIFCATLYVLGTHGINKVECYAQYGSNDLI